MLACNARNDLKTALEDSENPSTSGNQQTTRRGDSQRKASQALQYPGRTL